MAYKTETESTNELRTHESELNGLDNIRKRVYLKVVYQLFKNYILII